MFKNININFSTIVTVSHITEVIQNKQKKTIYIFLVFNTKYFSARAFTSWVRVGGARNNSMTLNATINR